jgi:hypothetical protein
MISRSTSQINPRLFDGLFTSDAAALLVIESPVKNRKSCGSDLQSQTDRVRCAAPSAWPLAG